MNGCPRFGMSTPSPSTWTGTAVRLTMGTFLTAVAALSACAPFLRQSGGRGDSWIPLPNGAYRFSNQDMDILFHPTERQHFLWRFSNKTLVSLEIPQEHLSLRRAGIPESYTLWGQPKQKEKPPPPIRIEPGGFVSLDFPVQYSSPLYPFEVKSESEVWLEFRAKWRRRSVDYRITFPKSLSRQAVEEGGP